MKGNPFNPPIITSDEGDWSFNIDDGVDGHNEVSKGKKASPCPHVKWTDDMVQLLITAVSYMGEDVAPECQKRKTAVSQKAAKWKSISKVLAERGCYASPQQCEDKFNDLNKRYKKLTDILRWGAACKVVHNPALLNLMDNLTDKVKDDVRKILTSEQLFYKELCSCHNGNRLRLPADPALQRSLQLALRSRDEHDTMNLCVLHDIDEDSDTEADSEGNNTLHLDSGVSCFQNSMNEGVNFEHITFEASPIPQKRNRTTNIQDMSVDMNQPIVEGSNTDGAEKRGVSNRLLELDERRLQIQATILEFEQKRLKWQVFNWEKEGGLEKLRLKNGRNRIENEQMALEIKRKQLEIGLN